MTQKSSVCVLVNVFSRPYNIEKLITAYAGQSIVPKRIHLYIEQSENNSKDYYEQLYLKLKLDLIDSPRLDTLKISFCISGLNTGVWGRFIYAENFSEEFILIADDDTIPGRRWIENCLKHCILYDAACTTYGLRFRGDTFDYFDHDKFGWMRPSAIPNAVDFMGQCWFLKRIWLHKINYACLNLLYPRSGEDLFMSLYITKLLKKRILVPPHPANDIHLWGSINAIKEGCDQGAISMSSDAIHIFRMQFINTRFLGARLLDDSQLKLSISINDFTSTLDALSSIVLNSLNRIEGHDNTYCIDHNSWSIIDSFDIDFCGKLIAIMHNLSIPKKFILLSLPAIVLRHVIAHK